MEELYLEMPNGNVPIDPKFVEVQFAEGHASSFSRNRIVGAKGEYFIEPSKQEQVRDRGAKGSLRWISRRRDRNHGQWF